MLIRTVAEPAFSGRKTFDVTGHYFELLDVDSPVDVYGYDANGNEFLQALQVSEGFYIDRMGLDPFVRLAIVTGSSLAVKFIYSDGRTGTRAAPISVQDDSSTRGSFTYGPTTQGAVDAQLFAANASRKGIAIQNQDASADLYVRIGGGAATASSASLKIAAGGYWEPRVAPTGEVRAISSSGTINIHCWQV